MEAIYRRTFPLLVGLAATASVYGVVMSFVLARQDGARPVSTGAHLVMSAVLVIAVTLLILWRAEPVRRRVLASALLVLTSSAALYGAASGWDATVKISFLAAAITQLMVCVAVTAIRADQPRPARAARL